jgi:hypothetical protein
MATSPQALPAMLVSLGKHLPWLARRKSRPYTDGMAGAAARNIASFRGEGVRTLMMRVRPIGLQLSGENSPAMRFALAWEQKSATGPLIGTEISDRSRGSW